MIEPALPTPTYISRRDFGCQACRHAFDQLPLGGRSTPAVLMPVAEHLGTGLLPWTDPFYACRQCHSIWAVNFNAKDLIVEMTPTPPGMEQALRPGAKLDQVMVPLFAWAPVDEMTEIALWQTQYEPQRLMDRLVAAWHHPDVDFNRQLDILRQMARLVSCNNPYHLALQQQRGWLLESHRGFDQVATELEGNLGNSSGLWAHVPSYVHDNVETLQKKLAQPAVIQDLPPDAVVNPQSRAIPDPVEQASAEEQETADAAIEHIERTIGGRFMQLLTPYWSFLPAIAGAWLIERIIGNLPPDAQAGGSLLLVLVLVLNGVAVMKNAGVSEGSFGYLLWHRLSAIGDYLVFALLVAATVIASTALVAMFGLKVASLSPAWQVTGLVACVGLLLVRFWPFWVIPYMQRVEDDVPSPRAYGITRRSALLTAWQLTGQATVFVRLTLPWLLLLSVAIAMTLVAFALTSDWARFGLIYAIILPAISAVTWALVERMTPSPI
ncbi:MAG: hypothetical protein DHS20C11_21540 [Lysobacteraceae bacterium]|nr:MAG: hypothetical protein DHS20C11_21540 [Xanthomonadaceae bacterium]